ncbi:hypothetical protein HanOQP8_Chr02g0048261 [Helianthus annuus]|nr:hypothetical protein HanOQP8_Chr02g0048261 [Helianthus annuus]
MIIEFVILGCITPGFATSLSKLGFRVCKHRVCADKIHRNIQMARDVLMWLGPGYVFQLKAQGRDVKAQPCFIAVVQAEVGL